MLQLCILMSDSILPIMRGLGTGNKKKRSILNTKVLDGSMQEGGLQKRIMIHIQLHMRICRIKILEGLEVIVGS